MFSSDVSVANQLEWEGFKVPLRHAPRDLGRGHRRRRGEVRRYRGIVDVLQGSTSLKKSIEDWGWELFLVRDSDEADALRSGGHFRARARRRLHPVRAAGKAVNGVNCTDTMRRTRILRWASLSAALAACAAALAAVSLTGWSLFQPDTRYMVAIGRWIIEQRAPTTDPLTLHDGLSISASSGPCASPPRPSSLTTFRGEAGIRCAAADARHGRGGDPLGLHPRPRGRTGAVHMGGIGRMRRGHSRAATQRRAAIDVMALCVCYAAGGKWTRDEAGRTPLLAVFPVAGLAMAQLHGALWTVAPWSRAASYSTAGSTGTAALKALTAAVSTVAACSPPPTAPGCSWCRSPPHGRRSR